MTHTQDMPVRIVDAVGCVSDVVKGGRANVTVFDRLKCVMVGLRLCLMWRSSGEEHECVLWNFIVAGDGRH